MDGQPFVGRERELAQLDAFLARALAGQGQVCFLVGEAGSGKTALAGAFARRAQEVEPELVVAVGQGDAQTGAGDAYLPFREVLQELTGDVEGKLGRGGITPENAGRLRKTLRLSGQALVEVGPDLVGIFVPGGGLLLRAGAFVAEKVGWLDKLEHLLSRPKPVALEQDHILEQYTNVLCAVAEKTPLLLILDDLQWADAGSLELLFRLGRRVGNDRILIVGTYRPDEVALGRAGDRHPLEKVVAEFKRYMGEIEVRLDTEAAAGRRFIDALLDAAPNALEEAFRQSLFTHTGGHPLFTVEILRALEERGALIRDAEGRWTTSAVLDWQVLPARVEGVIEERIGRLDPELRRLLTAASVEGESFAAEVVAQVLGLEERVVVRQLSGELERQHRLVHAQGTQRVGERRLSCYRFRHNLFQRYLYDTLDQVERSYLHQDIGGALEDLVGERAGEMAVQLARHFVQAQDEARSRRYLRLAGEQAAARYANVEAASFFSQALALAPETDLAGRYTLLTARERVYDLLGAREDQSADLAALEHLAAAMADDAKRAAVALRRANYAEATGDYLAAIEAARLAVTLAEAGGDVPGQAAGYLARGLALLRQGEHTAARAQLEQALPMVKAAALRHLEANYLRSLGNVSWQQGDFAKARTCWEEAVSVYREVGDRRGERMTLSNLGIVSKDQGDLAGARFYQEQALCIAREMGDRRGEGIALNNLGLFYVAQGDYAATRSCHEQAARLYREIGERRGEGMSLNNLGNTSVVLGDHAAAYEYDVQALAIAQELGDRWSESLALNGLADVCNCRGDYTEAQAYAERSLHIARETGDPEGEGFALTYLGHALAAQGEWAPASVAHEQALAIRRALGEAQLALENLAALAGAALAQKDLAAARERAEEVLRYLESHPALEGTENPMGVLMPCYRVLRAGGDPRDRRVLAAAYRLLQDRAALISDAAMRRSFLERVAAHREVEQEYARRGRPDTE